MERTGPRTSNFGPTGAMVSGTFFASNASEASAHGGRAAGPHASSATRRALRIARQHEGARVLRHVVEEALSARRVLDGGGALLEVRAGEADGGAEGREVARLAQGLGPGEAH